MHGYQYVPLGEPQPQKPPNRHLLLKWLYSVGLALLPLLGFLLGRKSHLITELPSSQHYELLSDTLFGDIPWQPVLMETDQQFIDNDPYAYYPNHTRIPSIWDTIYPGTFIAVSDPAAVRMEGKGMPMAHVAADPSAWPKASEGFGVAAMHQLHCVMSLKQAITSYEQVDTKHAGHGRAGPGHLRHCLEILRQAVMCQADLTLNPPHDEHGTQLSSGWGGVHMCRDWNKVYRAVTGMRISRGTDGWLDTSKNL